MNASDMLDSYVRDVAYCLPRRKRNDIAFELRSLLSDELAARSQAEGREPDKAMVFDLLKGFGRPADAAARYHERPALIASADTHHYLIWALAGAVVLGVLSPLSRSGALDRDLFLQWLGVLTIVFALMGWWRRRHPDSMRWRPKRSPDSVPRGLAALEAVATLVFPLWMYIAPMAFARIVFLGAIPTEGLELTDAFVQSWQRAATIAALALAVVLYAVVAIHGGWRPWTRWASILANMSLGLLLVIHAAPMTALSGGEPFRVFASATANQVATPIFALVGAMHILCVLYVIYREWMRITPAPAIRRERA